jgi:hypothetical protein
MDPPATDGDAGRAWQWIERAPKDHNAWVGAASILAWISDRDGYDRVRGEMLAKYGASVNPIIAERTAKACLLFPGRDAVAEHAARLTALPVALADDAPAREVGRPNARAYSIDSDSSCVALRISLAFGIGKLTKVSSVLILADICGASDASAIPAAAESGESMRIFNPRAKRSIMIGYFGRNYHSTAIGVRLVEVSCDQCGSTYFFELARAGAGAATAPYAIGTARAERSAADQARRDRDRRLVEEAELVPCPKCLWINDHLVTGYRRGRFRGASKAAAGIAIAGVCLTLVTAWVASLGPAPAHSGTIASILTVGMTVSLAVPASILLLRQFLRQRIQPNRDYPLPPKLPHGTPTALVRNSGTGVLEPAGRPVRPGDGIGAAVGAWINYQIGRSTLPPVCCDCLGPDSPRFAYHYSAASALGLTVPLCKACARRWTGRKWLGALVTFAAAAVFDIPLLLVLKLDEIIFWAVVLLAGTLLPVVGAMIAGWRAAPVRVKTVDKSRAVIRLWFRNEHYLSDVATNPGSASLT